MGLLRAVENVGFEVPIAAAMKIAVFWDVTSCSLQTSVSEESAASVVSVEDQTACAKRYMAKGMGAVRSDCRPEEARTCRQEGRWRVGCEKGL